MEKPNIKVAFCPEHGLQFFDAQGSPCKHILHEEKTMEYPEEIYATLDGGLLTESQRSRAVAMWPRRHAYEVGYEAGKAETADPLAGYSNLTGAISVGDPIDWAQLNGRKVKCINPAVGTAMGVMDRDVRSPIDEAHGWWNLEMDQIYTKAFCTAWYGKYGWTLWIEGEVPMRRKTADQLDVGTYFREVEGGALMYVGAGHQRGLKAVYRSPEMFVSPVPAEKWEVIEEYGTFQKPEGK